jgi:pimeloyl-ACP methyl ester carboxylesterase
MSINVEIAGPEDAIPLVLVHGAGGSAATWYMQVRGLSKTFRVHALELNGHGHSQDRSEEDTGGSYLEDVHSVVSSLDRPILGGHSMGGALTQLYALKNWELLRGIILVGTGARLRVNSLIFEWLENDFDSYIEALGHFVFDESADPRLVEASKKEARRCKLGIIARDFAFCNKFDIMERVPEIKNETLVLVGESDKMTPVKYSQYLADKIPNSELHIIPNAGHSVMLEQYAVLNEHIQNWAAKLH